MSPSARKKSKTSKRRVDPEKFLQQECRERVVLAVDPAATSGWAILSGPQLRLHGSGALEVFSSRRIEDVVSEAISIARSLNLPLTLAVEHWPRPHPGKGVEGYLGQGEARGVWRREYLLSIKEAARESNPRHGSQPIFANRVEKIDVNTWRGALIVLTGVRVNTPAEATISSFHHVRIQCGEWSTITEAIDAKTFAKKIRDLKGPITAKASSGSVILSTKAVGESAVMTVDGKESMGKAQKWRAFQTDEWKEKAIERVKEIHGMDTTPDEAEAILIGHYALRI